MSNIGSIGVYAEKHGTQIHQQYHDGNKQHKTLNQQKYPRDANQAPCGLHVSVLMLMLFKSDDIGQFVSVDIQKYECKSTVEFPHNQVQHDLEVRTAIWIYSNGDDPKQSKPKYLHAQIEEDVAVPLLFGCRYVIALPDFDGCNRHINND